ncbi:hypothetical protein J3F83DRAFT_727673 [Trichoderma novae-zelandiae]
MSVYEKHLPSNPAFRRECAPTKLRQTGIAAVSTKREMSAVSSDSREFLGVPRGAHSFRSSYHRLARKCRRKASPSVPTTTALVSAALTSAAPVVKFEARRTRVVFVPEISRPSQSSSAIANPTSLSWASLSTAVEGQELTPPTSSPDSASARLRPRISIRTTSNDGSFSHKTPVAKESLWISTSKESPISPTPSQPLTPASPTSPWLEVPPSPHSPRRNRFSRGHSPTRPLRNASQDSSTSPVSSKTTASPVSPHDLNKFEYLLQAMGSLVDDHVKQLRGSFLLPVSKSSRLPRDHCRETLVALQQELHTLLQRQATDPTNTLRYRSLWELYHELREKLVGFQRDLSAERVSDNYCEDFCRSIADYRSRLAFFVINTW